MQTRVTVVTIDNGHNETPNGLNGLQVMPDRPGRRGPRNGGGAVGMRLGGRNDDGPAGAGARLRRAREGWGGA